MATTERHAERHPLDPLEGPTAWVEIHPLDTAEKTHVTIKFGTDPNDPMREMTLNGREAKRLADAIQDSPNFEAPK